MKRIKYLLPIIALAFVVLFSCNKKDDNGVVFIPPRERSDEAIASQLEIEEYLETHFYNYEEFENPSPDFDYIVKLDTIEGTNALKTPLIQQVDFKNVTDIHDDTVSYKLYYLKVKQGEGDSPNFTDILTMIYSGSLLTDGSVFDSTVTPDQPLDLTQTIEGFQAALVEFNGATGFIENGDGSLTFENYGVGAVFIPSGLGYFNTPSTSAIPLYAQLIFTFQLYSVKKGDQDGDGILSVFEDLDGDGFELNDDTDGNGIPNFADPDDDGDGRLTKNEVEANEYVINLGDADPELGPNEVEMYRETDDVTGEITIYTIDFIDANNDGIPDYLDDNL